MHSSRMLKKAINRLLTRHPSGVLRVAVLQCTTSGRLRVCCWRAAQNRDCVFACVYRAATVRESVPKSLFQQPARRQMRWKQSIVNRMISEPPSQYWGREPGTRAQSVQDLKPIARLRVRQLRRASLTPNQSMTQLTDSFIALRNTARRVTQRAAPRTGQPVACRKCRWSCAHRSKRRTGLDSLMALFFLHPFRCRSCRRRYYRLSL